MKDYNIHTLKNGIQLIHSPLKSEVAYCGIIINAGSRDENRGEHGLAHFIEHVIFKGTKKRKAYEIISRLEDVGGELNGYTTKEETCFYATFMKEYYDRAFELLSDIFYNSVFPANEMKKEKVVVMDEINSYKDAPSELVYDEFEDSVFKGTQLGHSILGTPASLKTFNKKHVQDFIQRTYNTDQYIISTVGNIKFSDLVKIFEKYFSKAPSSIRTFNRSFIHKYKPEIKVKNKDTHQCHCIMGNVAYSITDEKRVPMYLLNNIICGTGMNSRLNIALRERSGLAYNVESNFHPYTDTGLFHIYFSTDKDTLDKSVDIVNKELKKLCVQKLNADQLAKAKKQIMGHLAIASESNESKMLSYGKSYLLFNKVDSLPEIKKKLEVITASKIRDVANEVLHKNQLSMLIFK